MLTPTTIVIALLAVLAGYITQAVNTGSVFGVATLPKPWLPYLTLAGLFLSSCVGSIAQAPIKDNAAWFTAVLAGMIALGGSATGATIKQQLDAHKRAPTPLASDVKPLSTPGGIGGAATMLVAGLGFARVLGAFLAATLLVLMLAIPVNGCSLFASGSKFPTDAENAAACVVADIEQGQTNVGTIVTDCSSFAPALIIDIVGALTNSPQFVAAHPTATAPLKASLATARASK